MKDYFFSSESVTAGHPDKLCDYIADTILDECLKQYPESKVAIEVLASKNIIAVTGQVNTTAKVNVEELVRNIIKEIGYDNDACDLNHDTCQVVTNITKQSPDIAEIIKDDGAGDQGTIFGFACNETEELMPLPIIFSHDLISKLDIARKNNIITGLRPDGKTQVTIEYKDNKPVRADTIIISAQHIEDKELNTLRKEILEEVILKSKYSNFLDENTKININDKGKFVLGGPCTDTGLTGRKLMVDTYGGYARHGGGAMSGKDATKVDRSAAYMLRHIAKNIVANNLAEKIEIAASYAIGEEYPVSIYLNTYDTNKIPEEEILNIIKENFDLSVKSMIEYLKLKDPIYTRHNKLRPHGQRKPKLGESDKIKIIVGFCRTKNLDLCK